MRVIRVGTRGSDLARWQAGHVADLLRAADADLAVEMVIIATTGDRILEAPLAKIGGKGLFTKEIEDALLEHRIDLAVHSLKDLPTTLPDGLALGAVLSREEPCDVLVSARGERFEELRAGARIGTSSLRRQAQLKFARPEIGVVSIRGNVLTRLCKARSGEVDAVVLARAGLVRLGLAGAITEVLSYDLLLPAPGQGALGIEIRSGDSATAAVLEGLEDRPTRSATDAERAFLQALGGGCQIPIGALAVPVSGSPDLLRLAAMVAAVDGSRLLRGERFGSVQEARSLGYALAGDLMERGAQEILEAVRLGGGEQGDPSATP